MGGKPSKQTPADRRLKANNSGGTKPAMQPASKPKGKK